MVSKSYTKADFQKDLQKLSQLMSKGGSSPLADQESLSGGAKKRKTLKKKSATKKAPKKAVKKVVKKKAVKKGGAVSSTRRFKIVEVNGKSVTSSARVEVKKGGPISAARKLLTAHCREMKIKGNRRLGVHVTYTIQETTSGSKHKLYGPYKGHFVKYTAEELKDKVVGGIQRTVKAIVRPVRTKSASSSSRKSKSKKGGAHSMHHHKKVSGGWGSYNNENNNRNNSFDEDEEDNE